MKKLYFVVMLIVVLVTACNPATPVPIVEPVPTETSVPPTETPIPPTDTPVPPTDTPIPPTETPKPTRTPTPPELAGKFDVGGYELYIRCKPGDGPVVILDAGHTMGTQSWSKVMTKINRLGLMVCAYDRLGIGKSDPAPAGPRTSEDIVLELRNLLRAADIPGPYIYVGHSMSGMTGWLYGAQYPDEIAGMVLVDPSHPDVHTKTMELLPAESANESTSVAILRFNHELGYKGPTTNGLTDPVTIEWWDFDTSAAQIKDAGYLGDLPLVVLMRDITATEAQAAFRKFYGVGELDPDWAEKLDNLWETLMVDTAALSTNSELIVAEGSSHMIPDENSQSVVDAVSLVLEMIEDASE